MTTSYYPAKSPGISEITFVRSGLSGDSKYLLYRMGHKETNTRSDPDLGKAPTASQVFLGYELL